jgi:uncharacterized protein YjdB
MALSGCHRLTQVRIQPATSELDGAAQTTQLRARALDSNGNDMPKQPALQWSSDQPSVATVDATGKVTSQKSGHATVTASAGSVKGTATVDVHVPAQITGADITLAGPGQVQPVTFQVNDENNQPIAALASAVRVTVADPSIATVDGSESNACRVTAVGIGQTRLTASIGSLSQAFNLTVSAPVITDLRVGKTSLKMKVGESQAISATAMVAAAEAPSSLITYASSNASVASVDPDGTIHALARGKATITVNAGQKSASVSVVVKR